MNDWIVTVPKTTRWDDYLKEIEFVKDGHNVMRYRMPPKIRVEAIAAGDRCWIVYDGKVRGWMSVTGIVKVNEVWECQTTGRRWPPGWYLERSGPFTFVDGPAYMGFRGFRRFREADSIR